MTPTCIIHMGAQFKASIKRKASDPVIVVSDGGKSSPYRLVNEVDILDDRGKLVARVKAACTTPRVVSGHEAHSWIEVYGAQIETR